MTIFGILQVKKTSFESWMAGESTPQTLLQVKPGKRAKVSGFSSKLSPERKLHLQAYGVIPGRDIQVRQHNPITVIQVEQTEIAIESGLAEEILVKYEEG